MKRAVDEYRQLYSLNAEQEEICYEFYKELQIMIKKTIEKSWTTFYQQVYARPEILCKWSPVLKMEKKIVAALALYLMGSAIGANFNLQHPGNTSQKEITDEEKQGLAWIAGYIIKKEIRKCDTDHDIGKLNFLKAMLTSDKFMCNEYTLINCQDRGGLTRPSINTINCCIAMENVFRKEMIKNEIGWQSEHFIRECKNNSIFNQMKKNYVADANVIKEETKDVICTNMIKLFFKIRVHSHAENITDKIKYKAKSLRKELKAHKNK